ncbi:MAG TPA: hypothetical protein VD969_01130 [Symbiobacteriaceae bacterium]|nr:hypothetical protein [Symbiobacteriaceae bacterium]
MKWTALALIAAVAWYVWNGARVTWKGGNRGGAAVIGLLAVVTLVVPFMMLFFWAQSR